MRADRSQTGRNVSTSKPISRWLGKPTEPKALDLAHAEIGSTALRDLFRSEARLEIDQVLLELSLGEYHKRFSSDLGVAPRARLGRMPLAAFHAREILEQNANKDTRVDRRFASGLNRTFSPSYAARDRVPQFPATLRPLCADERAFIRAMMANPLDDLTRLVFADWLDEHQSHILRAKGEFLRRQLHEAQTGSQVGPQIAFRDGRFEWELIGAIYGISDRRAAEVFCRSATFERGTMSGFEVTSEAVARLLPDLSAREPIKTLRLSMSEISRDVASRCRFPYLKQLVLDWESEAAANLLTSEILPRLTELTVTRAWTVAASTWRRHLRGWSGDPLKLCIQDTNIPTEEVGTSLPLESLSVKGMVRVLGMPPGGDQYPFARSCNFLKKVVFEQAARSPLDLNPDRWVLEVESAPALKVFATPRISFETFERLVIHGNFRQLTEIYATVVEYPDYTDVPGRPPPEPVPVPIEQLEEILMRSSRFITLRPFSEFREESY